MIKKINLTRKTQTKQKINSFYFCQTLLDRPFNANLQYVQI